MALPESLTDNGPIDRNFRALDERFPQTQGTWFGFPNFGASTTPTPTANLVYYAQIVVPMATTLTGLSFFMVTIGAGNTARAALYSSTGTRLANRTTNSSALSALTYPKIAFDTPYAAAPGTYFAALVFANAQGTFQMVVPTVPSGSVAGPGSGATATSITPPTTLGTGVPAMSTY